MTTTAGHKVTEKQDIADVFATFYEELYKSRERADEKKETEEEYDQRSGSREEMAFTIEELTSAVKSMKRGKTKDQRGIIAEMVKSGSTKLHQCILCVFNSILAREALPPKQWKETQIKVIFKKGDKDMPQNYRPISILPILYKLFSKMLCAKLTKHIMKSQTVDQAAYRKGFCAEDHLLTVALTIEK